MPRSFQQVDVFTTSPYTGNPVAVVLDADGLSTDEMERFTAWTNLSECTFVLPPTQSSADYRVRIFTGATPTAARQAIASELPFAGHPTLGTCHAWLVSGGQPHDERRIIQECGAGLVPIRRTPVGLAFAAPPLLHSGPVDESLLAHIADVLRLRRGEITDAAWADNGPGWVAVLLSSAEAVLALQPGFVDLDLGVVGPHRPGAETAFELRAFFPRNGSTVEDPVTGSLNASVAQWLIASERARAPYVASQGTALGRAGRIHIDQDDEAIWIGGGTITCLTGTAEL
jgi:PhzF family phenazine biosynthesis protein